MPPGTARVPTGDGGHVFIPWFHTNFCLEGLSAILV